ncbi:hypothetical protein AO367_0781 [Moraxella catarrhalis]|nr:hypothetical protein AO367_0781 [Moraxella catarrhalis]
MGDWLICDDWCLVFYPYLKPNQPMTHFGNLYNLIKIATYRNHLISLFAFLCRLPYSDLAK